MRNKLLAVAEAEGPAGGGTHTASLCAMGAKIVSKFFKYIDTFHFILYGDLYELWKRIF
jgi:hypothetical protein